MTTLFHSGGPNPAASDPNRWLQGRHESNEHLRTTNSYRSICDQRAVCCPWSFRSRRYRRCFSNAVAASGMAGIHRDSRCFPYPHLPRTESARCLVSTAAPMTTRANQTRWPTPAESVSVAAGCRRPGVAALTSLVATCVTTITPACQTRHRKKHL